VVRVLVVVCAEVYGGVGSEKSREGNSEGEGIVWAKACSRSKLSSKWSEGGGVVGEGKLMWRWSGAVSVGDLAEGAPAACGTLSRSLGVKLEDREDSSENDG
jgi:hypothetical protein